MPASPKSGGTSVLQQTFQSIGLTDAAALDFLKVYRHGVRDLHDLFLTFGNNLDALSSHLFTRLEQREGAVFSSSDTLRIRILHHWFLQQDPDAVDWKSFSKEEFTKFRHEIHCGHLEVLTTDDVVGTASPAPGGPKPPPATTTSTLGHSELDISERTLELDAAGTHARAHPSPTFALKPHPLWKSGFARHACGKVNMTTFQEFEGALTTESPKAIIEWYNTFQYMCATIQVDLCPVSSFKTEHALWPCNRCAEIVFENNTILHLKLTNPGFIDLQQPTLDIYYRAFLEAPTSKLNAYSFLHALLSFAVPRLKRTIPASPHLADCDTVATYGAQLLKYFRQMEHLGHHFTPRSQSEMFLAELQRHKLNVDFYTSKLSIIPPTHPIPQELTVPMLTVEIHGTKQYTPIHPIIHRTNRSPTNSTITTDTESATGNGSKKPPRERPFYTPHAGQCEACSMWGHRVENCRIAAQWYHIQKYYSKQPNQLQSIATKWQQINDRTIKRTVAHHLQSLHPDLYQHRSEEDIIESLGNLALDNFPDFH